MSALLDPKLVRYARQRQRDQARVAFGRALAAWIHRTGRTQLGLAREMGLERTVVNHWITATTTASAENRVKLAALGFDPEAAP